MIADPTATSLTLAEQHWAEVLAHFQNGQMSAQTFDFCLRSSRVVAVENGSYQVGIANSAALDWLQNREGIRIAIKRELDNVTGVSLSLDFIPLPTTLPPLLEGAGVAEAGPVTAGPSEAGHTLARINYYSAYFEPRGTGFNQIPHPYTYYWQFLLGPAFSLWLLLMSDEKSPLTKNPATWWGQPRLYSFEKLTQRLNKAHPRYVAGDELECTRSRESRKDGKPLQRPADCCGGPRYEWLRFKKHPRGGLICAHWSAGLLEILVRWQLVVVELNEGYKCKIQVWRMLPYLTPYQVGLLHPTIQADYEDFLREHGPRLDPPLYFPFWQTTTEENIVPLLPTRDMPEITHNFDERRNYQEFKRHAVPNPNYAGNQEDEADDEAP